MTKTFNYFTTIQFLSRYIGCHRKNFIMFYCGWFFDTALSMILPILSGIMIDQIIYYQDLDTFFRISLVFAVMLIFSCVLYFFIYAQHHYLMNMYTLDIRRELFEHMQKCDAQYMSEASSGDIIMMLQSYSQECMHFIVRNVIHFFNGLLRICGIILYLFVLDWRIGFFILVAAPVSVIINTVAGEKIRSFGSRQRECYGTYVSWVFECLSGIRDIRMLGATQKTNRTFEESHKRMFDVSIRSGIASLTASNMIKLTNLLTQIAIFTFAGYLAQSGGITMGSLLIIVTFFEQLISRISETSASFLDGQRRVSYVQRIWDFLHSPTENTWGGSKELKITEGTISFCQVKFSYGGTVPVLSGLNLEIPAGERFALVGKSGCGKSTLAYMLIGFYHPEEGEILVDGQRLCDCSLKSIRRNIGLIAQDVLIFDGTIKENILLGNKRASDEEILAVCRQAGLGELIESLPEGMNTLVGSCGMSLSGGQRQRIAIARIYLRNPKIIIFDEATSALDGETEEAIHEAWKSVLSGRTSIVIAHRQSSVMHCGRVAILENGRIYEQGIPEKMAQESEAFRTLFAVEKEEENDR